MADDCRRLLVSALVPEGELIHRSAGDGEQEGTEERVASTATVLSCSLQDGSVQVILRYRVMHEVIQAGCEPVRSCKERDVTLRLDPFGQPQPQPEAAAGRNLTWMAAVHPGRGATGVRCRCYAPVATG